MDDTTKNDAQTKQPEKKSPPTKGGSTSETDRRQAAALKAFLAQQRAAMGFT